MSERLRIVHVIWGLEPGGAERQLAALVYAQKEFHDVSVCCLECGGAVADELAEQGTHVEIIGKSSGVDLKALMKLARFLKKNKTQIVHSHIWGANFWARLAAIIARVPIRITHEHSTFGVDDIKRKLIDRILSRFTDAVICVSHEILRRTRQESGVSEDKLVLIRNGLELERFGASEGLRRKALSFRAQANRPPLVVIVGALEPRKDHKTFIQAAARVLDKGENAEFAIVGDGPLRGELEQMVAESGHKRQIIFTGALKDVREVLYESSVYVSSSVTEGVSIALLEAMACGVPVVATAVGGTIEVARGAANMMLVPVGKVREMADAIMALLQCVGAGEELARAAQKTVTERFDAKVMNRRILELYDELAARKGIVEKDDEVCNELGEGYSFEKQPGFLRRVGRFALSRAPFIGSPLGSARLKEGQVRVLTYHRVRNGFSADRLSVSTADFIRQMTWLFESGVPVLTVSESLEKMRSGNLPFGAFALSFDDGYVDIYDEVRPVLREFGFAATAYLPSGLIESGDMIERYRGENGADRLINWSEAKELAEEGWELGAHSVSHANLSELSGSELVDEIRDCREVIKARTGAEVASFCFPGGRMSSGAVDEVKAAGYESACTVWPGANNKATPSLLLRRTEISGFDTMADFRRKLAGGFDFYQKRLQSGGVTDPRNINSGG